MKHQESDIKQKRNIPICEYIQEQDKRRSQNKEIPRFKVSAVQLQNFVIFHRQ